MSSSRGFFEAATKAPKRVVLPEEDDARVVSAIKELQSGGLAEPVPLEAGRDRIDYLAEKLAESREKLTIPMAKRLLSKPLYLAGMMVNAGLADIMVAGAAHPTRRVIEAGSMTVGLAPSIRTASSFFLMSWPDRSLVFADCAVNAEPTSEELADIALASAENARRLLGETPRVAFLSFSTHGSAVHPRVEKVQKAVAMAKTKVPGLAVDGDIQADAALIAEIAEKKLKKPSDVAGRANVLIFPDLDSGNIAYKLVQHLSGAKATGPILQGFAKPVADLSRGCSVDDIIETVVITGLMA